MYVIIYVKIGGYIRGEKGDGGCLIKREFEQYTVFKKPAIPVHSAWTIFCPKKTLPTSNEIMLTKLI